jgi:hypothetical protein
MEGALVLADKNVYFSDADGAVRAYDYVCRVLAKAKALKEMWERGFIEYAEETGQRSLVITPDVTVSVVKEKKEKFKTQEIYDLFNFTDVQRRILPANPTFRKGDLTAELGEEGLKDVLIVEFTDKVKVKEFDAKFMPSKGQKKVAPVDGSAPEGGINE